MAWAGLSAALFSAFAFGAPSPVEKADAQSRIEQRAQSIATELQRLCPQAESGDQRAFDACRQGLFDDSTLKRTLSDYVLWGRQFDPKIALKETKLTQFAPDVLTGMYVPLFMFNGKHSVEYVASEGLYLVRLQTAFRNRLAPGQFPYPFWHDAKKWSMYENASEVLLWVDPNTERVKAAQFTGVSANPPIVTNPSVKHAAFDGKWLWSDAAGRTQPVVTVFDGLYRADNPFLPKLDASYKALALRLREGQCFECHVPNNPDGMKKLVLLQTPAHAAGEIRRVLKSVREDKMPRDEFGIEQPLARQAKAALLAEGEAFAAIVDAARDWERGRSATRSLEATAASLSVTPAR